MRSTDLQTEEVRLRLVCERASRRRYCRMNGWMDLPLAMHGPSSVCPCKKGSMFENKEVFGGIWYYSI